MTLMNKYNKGITLIALVITIIILLILAGITLSTLTGKNGLLTRAKQAKEETLIAAAKEKLSIRIIDLSIEILDKENRSMELNDIIKIDSSEYKVKKNDDNSVYVAQYNEKDCAVVSCEGYEFYVFEDGTVIYTKEQVDEGGGKEEEEKKDSYSTTGLKVYLDGKNNTGNGQNKNATVWKDLSSNGKDATIYGATWMDDGLYFDGQNDWANLGYQDYGNYTLELVFETNKLGKQCILANWQDGGYGIYIVNSSKIAADSYINGSYNEVISSETLNTNTKYKVTSTCNGKEHKIYINGELVNSSTVQNGLIEIPDFNTIMTIRRRSIKR